MGEAETLPGLCQSQLFGVTSSLSVLSTLASWAWHLTDGRLKLWWSRWDIRRALELRY